MSSMTVLIADDDHLVLAVLTAGLEVAGYTVLAANNGVEAIRLAREHSPDFALLDMYMPGINGLDVAVWLREHTAIPFIFLSVDGDISTVTMAMQAGALGYLMKPLNAHQIIPAIQAALLRGREFTKLLEENTQLDVALKLGRQTSIAVGILMARYQLSEKAAFEQLRAQARKRRCKISEVASELLCNTESHARK